MEFDNGLSVSAGVAGYYYTGEFDDTYEEINLNVGYSLFNLEYSVGTWDNFGGPEWDYDFVALTVEKDGFYGTYGSFGDQFDGDYLELGYGTEIGGFDFGVAAIFASDDLSDEVEADGSPAAGESLTFSIGKTFDF